MENFLVLDARLSRWWHFRRKWTQHGARFIPAVSCCGTVCEPGRGSAALLKLPGFRLCHFAENRPTLAVQTPPGKKKTRAMGRIGELHLWVGKSLLNAAVSASERAASKKVSTKLLIFFPVWTLFVVGRRSAVSDWRSWRSMKRAQVSGKSNPEVTTLSRLPIKTKAGDSCGTREWASASRTLGLALFCGWQQHAGNVFSTRPQ